MEERENNSKWKKCLKKCLFRRIPICCWITNYTKEDAICDLIAGITISLTMIPQSIAYAALAGLSPQYGLNSAFMGCFIYVFLGTTKEVVIGPSSLMALLTYQYTYSLNEDFVILLCFLCGIVELLMCVLHLGFLIELISAPVVSAFTSATSVIIIVAQLKGLFGLYFKSFSFIDNLWQVFVHLKQSRLGDTILGISCIIILLFLRYLKELKLSERFPKRKFVKSIFWFLATARNALVVFGCCLISIAYEKNGLNTPFITTKHVESGLPELKFPAFQTQIGNTTYEFKDMLTELSGGYIIIPTVSVLANVAIAKAFARGTVDASQEMFALSLCNIFGSFFQSMPTAGAFTRSAVINASGVRTTFACLYSAAITLLALAFLAPYFHYIPRSALAAVLIAAVVFLIDWQIFFTLYKAKRLDFIALLFTFIGCLSLGVEKGMLVGILIGLLHLIYKWARPEVAVDLTKCSSGTYTTITPKTSLYFPCADYITYLISKNTLKEDGLQTSALINCSQITGSDFTVAKNFICLSHVFEKKGQQILLTNVPKKTLKIWKKAGIENSQFCELDKVEQSLFGNNFKKAENLDYNIKDIEEIQELVKEKE